MRNNIFLKVSFIKVAGPDKRKDTRLEEVRQVVHRFVCVSLSPGRVARSLKCLHTPYSSLSTPHGERNRERERG